MCLSYSCYARALKLMPEVPSLWCDLGLNYYHQASSQPCLKEGDQNSASLLLEKAQQVIQRLMHNMFVSFVPKS